MAEGPVDEDAAGKGLPRAWALRWAGVKADCWGWVGARPEGWRGRGGVEVEVCGVAAAGAGAA